MCRRRPQQRPLSRDVCLRFGDSLGGWGWSLFLPTLPLPPRLPQATQGSALPTHSLHSLQPASAVPRPPRRPLGASDFSYLLPRPLAAFPAINAI